MKLLSEPLVSDESPCSYIKGRYWRFAYFFALDVTAEELDTILSKGWRKFGMYYFKPACRDCRKCIPIRVKADELNLSRSQRRVVKDCKNIRVEFKDLEYRDEIFEIYKDHSLNRFSKNSNDEDFYTSFYTQSCPSMQSEYYIDNKLAGVGFLDVSSNSLSSIYFIYSSGFKNYRLGTFSAIKETGFALSLGLKYYYLGYFIENNSSMAYKNNFHINEKMDWETGKWLHEDLFTRTVLSQE
jgi:arginine-tRNA-protein transferase